MKRDELPLIALDGRRAGELHRAPPHPQATSGNEPPADDVCRSINRSADLIDMLGPWMLTVPGGAEVIEAWHHAVLQLGFFVACQALLAPDTMDPNRLPVVPVVQSQAQRPAGSYQDNAGTLVYVAHDAAGNILYVGVTDNIFIRMAQHQRESPWWQHMERLTWEEWPDRESALRKEARLIKAWRPPHNKAGNPEHRRKPR